MRSIRFSLLAAAGLLSTVRLMLLRPKTSQDAQSRTEAQGRGEGFWSRPGRGGVLTSFSSRDSDGRVPSYQRGARHGEARRPVNSRRGAHFNPANQSRMMSGRPSMRRHGRHQFTCMCKSRRAERRGCSIGGFSRWIRGKPNSCSMAGRFSRSSSQAKVTTIRRDPAGNAGAAIAWAVTGKSGRDSGSSLPRNVLQ